MQDINLKEAYSILKLCKAIELEGRLLVPLLHEIDDDYKNVFLSLYWQEEHEGELLDLSSEFEEGDNQTCILNGSKLVLVNVDGQEEELEILVPYYHKKI
jgi:hypothetical protein